MQMQQRCYRLKAIVPGSCHDNWTKTGEYCARGGESVRIIATRHEGVRRVPENKIARKREGPDARRTKVSAGPFSGNGLWERRERACCFSKVRRPKNYRPAQPR